MEKDQQTKEEREKEEQRRREQLGSHHIDVMINGGKPINPMEMLCADVERQLNSGYHISALEPDEIDILNKTYGHKWYKKWGYTKADLKEIVTTTPSLQPIKND